MDSLPPSARLLGIGFYIAICIVVGTIGGRELDKALDTGKVFTIIGLTAGLGLALYGGVKQLLEVVAATDQARKEEKRD